MTTEEKPVPPTPVVSAYEMEGLAPTHRNAKPSSAQHGEALLAYLRVLVLVSGDDAEVTTAEWHYVAADDHEAAGYPPPPEGWGIIKATVVTTDVSDFDIEVEPDTVAEVVENLIDRGIGHDPDDPEPEDIEVHNLPNPLGREVGATAECADCAGDFVLARPQRPLTIKAEWILVPTMRLVGADFDAKIVEGAHVTTEGYGPGRVRAVGPVLVEVESDKGPSQDYTEFRSAVMWIGA